jgi:ribosomal protein S18 acetylase RimI-like enzyme
LSIEIEVVEDGNIEQCRDLCNELMSFQKSRAIIAPEAFDNMNFETRLKASFENTPVHQIIIAKDNGIPIGYVFSTIENVNSGDKSHIPDWAPVEGLQVVKGFYPDWNHFPNKVGCLNHLFFKESYRGMGIGSKLLNMAMEWLESFPDVDVSFVYVSNGNDDALDFYIKHGFTFSHDVFGGFIKTAYKFRDR